MMDNRITENAISYIQKLFAGNAGGHDIGHTMRVYRTALQIAEREPGCDAMTAALAALLHDADDPKLFSTQNNRNARDFLEKNSVLPEKIDEICGIINSVSFSKNRDRAPETIEGKVVQDADRLDAIGAVGIARTFAYGGEHGRPLEESVQHFHDKLLLLKDRMNTETARRLAAERHDFLEKFLEQLGKEMYAPLCSGKLTQIRSGRSSAIVLYDEEAGHYIKIDGPGELAREAELGRLFHERGLGVEVLRYESAEKDILVTRRAEGEDLTNCLEDPKMLCEVLAEALRLLHAEPVGQAPVSSRLQRYLASAAGEFSGGFYDEGVLMDRYRIGSKEEAWEIMQSKKQLLRADTLIHGDACLPNIMQAAGRFRCFIDLNMAGVGDRHIDLYWALWSLQYNLGTDAWADRFLDLYGRENVSEEMLRVVAAFELFG